MKYKPHLLFIGIFLTSIIYGQQITEIEYFLNSDPGIGNGIPVSFSPDDIVETSFTVDLSTINLGINSLFVRAKDNSGKWGLYTKKTFYHVQGSFNNPNLTGIEYFFDDDPGLGNGTSIGFIHDSIASVSFTANLDTIGKGIHNLFLRTKDEFNRWSLSAKKAFYLIEGSSITPNIVNIEYFFDADPGLGNGIPVPITANDTIEMAFNLQTSGLAIGVHYFYVRAMDAKNRWSIYTMDSVNIENLSGFIAVNTFLEGPFNGTSMDAELNINNQIPLSQPYSGAPWNYPGTESVASIPNSNVVDWVLVEMRDAPDAASATSSTAIAKQAGFILNDGSIVGLDGVSNLQFNKTVSQQLFAVIYHRNHLSIMSANQLMQTDGVYIYDFTNPGQIYGGTNGSKELSPGIWGMVSGDGNGSGIIGNDDETAVWKPELGSSGYLGGDFNMNGVVQNTDETNYWKVNLNVGGQVPGKFGSKPYKSQVPK